MPERVVHRRYPDEGAAERNGDVAIRSTITAPAYGRGPIA